jgi:membrane complex biogenesis BtpA family protein
MSKFKDLFAAAKPIIGMVHIGALPGTPLYDEKKGVEGLIEDARTDLAALTAAGFDGIMFGNENDRPYQLQADQASVATMAYIIGRLKDLISCPFGVNVLWDPIASIALAAATDAHFVREIFTGTYASDMGIWSPDAASALRYRRQLERSDLVTLFNVSAEFADSLDTRSLPDRARSAVFSSIPDAILVSGQITGEAAELSQLEAVKAALTDIPVLANTGVKHETVSDILKIADGCIVGSSLKKDGHTWNMIDPARASDFMERVRKTRGKK